MKYFAYGSNMLVERLRVRVPDAVVIGTALTTGRRLLFHKRSLDGSGKCDIPETGNATDIVYGVLYDLPEDQLPNLERAEGNGYTRSTICVSSGGSVVQASAFLAMPEQINDKLLPHDWYLDLVVAGARQHALPAEYISFLIGTSKQPDLFVNRPARIQAIKVLPKTQYGIIENT
jgi:hypothetical protein